MPTPFKQWTVLPHEKPKRLEPGLLTVVGDLPMPLLDFPRCMTVVRLADGRLLIYSAMALEESDMKELEAWGRPSFLVVPGDLHRLDARIWKQRYPELFVVCPAGAQAKVEEVVRVDGTSVDFGDPRVQFVTVPGTDEHEAALLLDSEQGSTLIINDLIWNVDHRPGIGGALFRKLRLTGPAPQIPWVVRLKMIKDEAAVRAQLERWAATPNLRRLIVSHGAIVETEVPTLLRRLASSLGAA